MIKGWNAQASKFVKETLWAHNHLNAEQTNVTPAFLASLTGKRPVLKEVGMWQEILSGSASPTIYKSVFAELAELVPKTKSSLVVEHLMTGYSDAVNAHRDAKRPKIHEDGVRSYSLGDHSL